MAGAANGLAILRDEETESLWDHMTGECFEGPLEGARLDWWSVTMTNVATELAHHPETLLLESSHHSLKARAMQLLARSDGSKIESSRTFIPPTFRRTMSRPIDNRLPKKAQGLGVIFDNGEARYYPMTALHRGGEITDELAVGKVLVGRSDLDGSLSARWADNPDAEPPMQLMCRWYGFSFNFPNCSIYVSGSTK